jgi:hypothetical protein
MALEEEPAVTLEEEPPVALEEEPPVALQDAPLVEEAPPPPLEDAPPVEEAPPLPPEDAPLALMDRDADEAEAEPASPADEDASPPPTLGVPELDTPLRPPAEADVDAPLAPPTPSSSGGKEMKHAPTVKNTPASDALPTTLRTLMRHQLPANAIHRHDRPCSRHCESVFVAGARFRNGFEHLKSGRRIPNDHR